MNNKLLKAWMESEHLRPEELAVKLDVSFSTILSILKGSRPRFSTVKAISKMTGYTLDELLDEPKKSSKSK